jgi:hypothetical protein
MSRRADFVARQTNNIRNAASLVTRYAADARGRGDVSDALLAHVEAITGRISADAARVDEAVKYLDELGAPGDGPRSEGLTRLLELIERHGSVEAALSALAADDDAHAPPGAPGS